MEASLVNLFSNAFGRVLLYTLCINFANSNLYISSSFKKLRFLYQDVTGVRILLKVMALVI